MVAPAPVRALDGRPAANLLEVNGSVSQFNGRRPRRAVALPVHRSILTVDIEASTQRTNPVKGELRCELYRLIAGAFGLIGIGDKYCDPITDRGDGVLVLLRPADDFPKPFLLSRLLPGRETAHHAPAGGPARRGSAL